MFVKNYSDSDFVIKYNGGEKTLLSKDVTYIDEKWITFPMIYAMFGDYVGLIESNTPIEEFLFDNQTLAENDKVYAVAGQGPGQPRIFVKGGKATLYFSDVLPESIEDMYPSTPFTDIEGVVLLTALTNYIAVKADKKAKVIFTNIKIS